MRRHSSRAHPARLARAHGVAAAALLVAAACTPLAPPPPAPPYMTAFAANGLGYGYAEEKLGPDLWRITYHGPPQRLSLDPAFRRAELERASEGAADLALWRAAQLALAERRRALVVVDRKFDRETVERPGYFAADPLWPYPDYGFRYRYGIPGPIASREFVPADATGRVRAVLTVRFANRAEAASLDPAATDRRLSAIWAGRVPTP